MSEALVWLLYVLGGLLSFLTVHHRRWRITTATLGAAVLVTAAWSAWYWLTSEAERPPWFNVHLSLNFFFAVIFASAGAALGEYLARRQAEPPEQG